jgi:hypothetical protein
VCDLRYVRAIFKAVGSATAATVWNAESRPVSLFDATSIFDVPLLGTKWHGFGHGSKRRNTGSSSREGTGH